MRISDWSSDVCSSDLGEDAAAEAREDRDQRSAEGERDERVDDGAVVTADGETTRTGQIPEEDRDREQREARHQHTGDRAGAERHGQTRLQSGLRRSEEHTSELQSLMRNSYAVFCLKK